MAGKIQIPVCEKVLLTLDEASELFNIGRAKLKELTEERGCNFVLFNGNKRLIKRESFSKFLENTYSV